MTADEGRRDAVIVLARGRSARMGRPKGLLPTCRGGDVMAVTVWRLYAAHGWTGVLVAREDEAAVYAAAFAAGGGPLVQPAPDGGETARTVFAGWRALLDGPGPPPSHLWLHPVDLPLVSAATIAALRGASQAEPERVIRPRWRGRPGHPVVVPAAALRQVAAARGDWPGPWRQLLDSEAALCPLDLPAPDDGVCRDFDKPEDLKAAHGREPEGDSP